MKQISNIPTLRKGIIKSIIVPRLAHAGFSLYFGFTNSLGEFNSEFGFIGSGGLIFDSEQKFFGGYYIGQSLVLEVHFFGDRISYFLNGVIIRNNVSFSSCVNAIEFDKKGSSSAQITATYQSNPRILNSDGSFSLLSPLSSPSIENVIAPYGIAYSVYLLDCGD